MSIRKIGNRLTMICSKNQLVLRVVEGNRPCTANPAKPLSASRRRPVSAAL